MQLLGDKTVMPVFCKYMKKKNKKLNKDGRKKEKKKNK